MGRRRRQSDSSSGGSWMDTYGDLVTLLLTFFVLLYSFSSIDAAKWAALVNSMSRNGSTASQGAGRPPTGTGGAIGPQTGEPDDAGPDTDIADEQVDSGPTGTVDGGPTTVTESTASPPPATPTLRPTPRPTSKPVATTAKPTTSPAMAGFFKEMQSYLSGTPLAGSASLDQKGSQILIRLRVSLIFEPGSDKLKPEAQQILNETAVIISRNLKLVKTLRTEGHTDSVTPPTGDIESKWELAALRAARVLQQMVSRTGIEPNKAYTVGYGSTRPIAGDDTEAGRNKNNRVDIIIVN